MVCSVDYCEHKTWNNTSSVGVKGMDNLHCRLTFDPDIKKRNSRKEPLKSSKIPKFGGKML